MAVLNSFYSTNSFLNITYAIDIALYEHFGNLLLNGDQTRVVYSSNAYALRKRSDGNRGNLDFPFLNFKTTNYESGLRIWWNLSAWTKGIFLPDLEMKVITYPVTISYEASFWCKRDDEIRYAMSELLYDADNKTILKPEIEINSQIVYFPALVEYSPSYEPQYNEQDWLERNKIHTMTMDFTIDTFALKTNEDVSIPTEVLANFAMKNNIEEAINSEDYNHTYQLVVDHISEDVSES
jgi:hypothetical protein